MNSPQRPDDFDGATSPFEEALKRIALRPPSEGLDARIAASLASEARLRTHGRWAIAWPWAAAAALAMGIFGFIGGRESAAKPKQALAATRTVAPAAVQVQVIYRAATSPDPFDFTIPADDSLRPSIATTEGQGKQI